MAALPFDVVYRDFDIEGLPASGVHHPLKKDIRDSLNAQIAGPFPDNRVIRLNNGNEGSENEIRVTAAVDIPSAVFQVLYILNVTKENTGPVKVSGAINRELVTNTNQRVPSGYLTPGMAVLCVDTGTTLRMLSYGDMETLIVEAEDAVAAAQAARDLAAGYASDAVSQGNVPIYGTVQGVSALTIPAGINAFRLNGFAASGDGGGWPLAREVTNSGTLTAWQRQTNGGTRRWELVADYLSPLMFGAPTDGVTIADNNINTAIALAHARGQKFIDGNGLKYKVSSRTAISNLYGIELRNMYLIEDVSDGSYQINTYADDDKIHVGREYMYRIYNRLKNGGDGLRFFAFGDSTMEGPAGWPDGGTPWESFWQSMFPRLGTLKGLYLPVIAENKAIGGTRLPQMDALPYVTETADCFIIKYAINDASIGNGRLDVFAQALDEKLREIREKEFGSVYDLSIILVGPNSTFDPPFGRTSEWYERLRGIFVAAARKWKCAFFDTYAYMQDSSWAAGAWLDSPFPDNPKRGVHPEMIGYAWIWGEIFNWIFPDEVAHQWRRNHLQVTSGQFENLNAALPMNGVYYPYGISVKYAGMGNAWPTNGGVATVRHADSSSLQMVFGTDGKPTVRFRTLDLTSEYFGVWSGVELGLNFQNGWQEFDIPGWGASYCKRTVDGDVRVRLCARGGGTADSTVIAVLPVGYRPLSLERFHVFGINGNGGVIDVTAAGNIRVVSGVSTDMINASFTFRGA